MYMCTQDQGMYICTQDHVQAGSGSAHLRAGSGNAHVHAQDQALTWYQSRCAIGRISQQPGAGIGQHQLLGNKVVIHPNTSALH